MKIITFIQSLDGKINNNSLESFCAAQQLSESLNAENKVIAFDMEIAKKMSQYQSNGVILIDSHEVKTFNPIYYLHAIEKKINDYEPDLFFFGHTYETRDWVPRLSARLNLPFISDCISFDAENELSFIRPTFQAKLNERIALNNNKGIVSFQAGSFNAENLIKGSSEIETDTLDFTGVNPNVQPGEKFRESKNEVDLSSAEIIISIGRGIGKKENIPMVEKLAEKLNGQIAASRPVVDSGWLDHSRQIGSSGQTVSPKLYFSIGISGAIQHLVGMKGSKNIMAINKDPNAPIFEIADYAVIGDLFEILPKLTEKL